jgi:hypothetical protein
LHVEQWNTVHLKILIQAVGQILRS